MMIVDNGVNFVVCELFQRSIHDAFVAQLVRAWV
jgi:hypothetical protein